MSVCKKRIPALCSKSAIIFLIFFLSIYFIDISFPSRVSGVRCGHLFPQMSTCGHT